MRRDTSGEPSVSKRRASFSTPIDEEAVEDTKGASSTEPKKLEETSTIKDSNIIPKSAVDAPKLDAGKESGEEKKEVAKAKVEPKKAPSATSNGHTNGKATPAKTVEKAPASKTTPRPAPITTAKSSVPNKPSPIKSTNTPRTPTTPRGRGRQEEKKISDRNPQVKNGSRPSLAPGNTAKPASTSKTRIGASPPQTGFVKPKPRSPTRPVNLPASLMAHTASSGSKTASPPSRQTLSRASGNSQPANTLQAHTALARSPSRVTAPKGEKTLTRKPSTLKSASRPSLGPPPTKLNKKPSRQSLTREPSSADDGFLARMMRPTTSSASKVLTTPETPLARAPSVKRPITRDGTPKARDSPKPVPKVHEAPKVVPKVVKETIIPKVARAANKVASAVKPSTKKDNTAKSGPTVAKTTPKEEASKPVVSASKVESETPAVVDASSSAETEAQEPNVESPAEVSEPLVEPKSEEKVVDAEPETVEATEPETVKEEANGHTEVSDAKNEEAPVSIPTDELAIEEQKSTPPQATIEIPTTAIQPPTPVVQQDTTKPEVMKEAIVSNPDSEPELAKEVEEPTKIEDLTKVATPTPSAEPAEPLFPDPVVATPSEEVDDIVKTEVVKPAIIEDPEDVKAREEIARLNAEFLKAAEEEEAMKETY